MKREDLAHTGAHKINNTVGQALLARRMGKKRLIAETGAGQHGVAAAAAAARFGMPCRVFMGSEDMRRQAPNVRRMRLLGAEVVEVDAGTRTLKDATSEALREWSASSRDTHYLLGSALGPHPYPTIVRDFQAVIGREARRQILAAEGRLPYELVACVGGGSNAIGLFQGGAPGVLHGTYTFLLQDASGQVLPTHSVAAGLDYPAVGPEHAWLRDRGRVRYGFATDRQAREAFHLLCRTEGILPALESAHALAYVIERAPKMRKKEILLVNLSGRGDKDLEAWPP